MLVETQIERLSQSGEGIARVDGHSVFVDQAVPGDRALLELTETGKIWRGRLVQLLEPSPSRRTSRCSLSQTCGGCDWLHLDDDAQLAAKSEIVLSSLERIGGIGRESFTLGPIGAGPRSWRYRRRAVLHLRDGALGFFARRSHDVVPVANCPALVPLLEPLPGQMSDALQAIASDISEVRLLAAGSQVAFSVHLRGPAKERHLRFIEHCVESLGARGAIVTPRTGKGLLVGKPVLSEPAPLRAEVALSLRPDVFAQANESANEHLVSRAIDRLELTSGARALELFCGIGNFSFALAARAAQVVAIDSSPVALDGARFSADASGVRNVRFMRGDALEVARALAGEGKRFEVGLVDPPRVGAPGIGAVARGLGLKRLVYVSCDAGTLARDAGDLTRHGFHPTSLDLIDMFPQTRHVEAVMSFEAREDEGG